jgi:predicted nuclease of predicted toxin-antitoxin system
LSRSPDPFCILLDQNVPRSVAAWLRQARPHWQVIHAAEVALALASDEAVFDWAQAHRAVLLTYDADFADQRIYPVGTHVGVVRLRVYPTTAEATRAALERLLASVADDEMRGALIVVDERRIRLQPSTRRSP